MGKGKQGNLHSLLQKLEETKKMAIDLNSIRKTKHAYPPRILLHGPEKSGKSTFFSLAPDPIFIQTEDGLNGIDTNAFPLAESLSDVIEALKVLCTKDHDYKTVVLDSADWLEKLIHEKVCKDEGVVNIVRAGGGYGNGYSLAMNYWKEVVKALDYLNKQRGMIVGVICHSVVITHNDPTMEPYDVATLKLHSPKKGSGAADFFQEWVDVIGYASKKVFVTKAEGSNVARAVDAGEQCNQLILGRNPACMSGNRYNLPTQIPLKWSAFEDAIKSTATEKPTKPQPLKEVNKNG